MSHDKNKEYWIKQKDLLSILTPPASGNAILQDRVTKKKKPYQVGVYTKEVASVVYTFICDRCKKTCTNEQQPGRTPMHCKECLPEIKKEQARERARAFRARRKVDAAH